MRPESDGDSPIIAPQAVRQVSHESPVKAIRKFFLNVAPFGSPSVSHRESISYKTRYLSSDLRAPRNEKIVHLAKSGSVFTASVHASIQFLILAWPMSTQSR